MITSLAAMLAIKYGLKEAIHWPWYTVIGCGITLLTANLPVLYCGPTGTGKTLYVQNYVLGLPADVFSSIFINFNGVFYHPRLSDCLVYF